MPRRYLRTSRLVVGNEPGAIVVDGKPFPQGLRMTFEITRGTKEAQESSVTVTNLSPHTASLIREGDPIRFSAGYEGFDGQLIAGSVSGANSRREGQERLTTITFEVGGAKPREQTFSRSYGPGATRHLILRDMASLVGLGIANIDAITDDLLPDHVVEMPVGRAITKLLATVGTTWTEVDGQMVLHRVGADPGYAGSGVITVTPENGLVGSATPTDEGAQMVILLEPRVYVGTQINLTSAAVTGTFRVTECIHTGSSWEGENVTHVTMIRPDASSDE